MNGFYRFDKKHVSQISSCSEVERDPWCCSVIASRISDGLADPGKILNDITTCKGSDLGDPDGYLAGFPCQAGNTWGVQTKIKGLTLWSWPYTQWFFWVPLPGNISSGIDERVSRYKECITERTVSTIWWTKSCRETTEARFWISMRMQMFIVCECHLLFAISFHSFPPCPQKTQEVSLFRKCERDIEPEVSTRHGLFVAGPSTPTTPPNSFQQLPCQACAERGLRLIYCVVNGHQIGANVWDPGSWWPLESYFVP